MALKWAVLPAPANKHHVFDYRDDEDLAQEGLAHLLLEVRLSDDVLAAVRKKVALLQEGPVRRFSGLRLCAGLVLAAPEFGPVAAGWLRRSLVSADPLIAGEAVRALYLWLDAAQRNPGAVEPPDDLTEEVAGMLIARRHGTLERALEFAHWLFDHGPERLRPRIAQRCDLALSYILDETSYENEVLAGHETEGSVRQRGGKC